jgi:hypothetical protein
MVLSVDVKIDGQCHRFLFRHRCSDCAGYFDHRVGTTSTGSSGIVSSTDN